MKKILGISLSIIFFSCAGANKEAMRYKQNAENAMSADNFAGALAYVDSAVSACTDTACERGIYRWLIEISRKKGNDVYRAIGYEKLIMSHLKSSENSKSAPIAEIEYESARAVSREYLAWAESLNIARGDPFPAVDALLLSASIERRDNPDFALENLAKILSLADTSRGLLISPSLSKAIGKAKEIVDDIGNEMAHRFADAEKKLESNDTTELAQNLIWVYRSASAFGNAKIAVRSAQILVEFYKSKGDNKSSAEWAGRLLRWQAEIEMEKNRNE